MKHNPHTENGSAIVYIFIGVALFGALMFMFSRGGTQNSSALTDQQAKITASEIIEYSRTVEAAVNKLLLKGCSESEISFENTVVAGYTNPDSPIDYSCHVFRPEGGKLHWSLPPTLVDTPDDNYFFSKFRVNGWGTDGVSATAYDLAILLRNVPANVCSTINEMIKNTTIFPLDSNGVPSEDNGPMWAYPGSGIATPNTRFFKGDFANAGNQVTGDSETFSPSGSLICSKQFNADEYIVAGRLIVR